MARQLAGKGFDLELQYGKERERQLAALAEHTKVEVKSDRWVAKTGNLAVEYQQRINGCWQSSGIATSEADMQVFELVGLGTWLWVETERVKALARIARDEGHKRDIGDYGNHRCALVPVRWVVEPWRAADSRSASTLEPSASARLHVVERAS